MNKCLDITEPGEVFSAENMIVSHTPFKSKVFDDYKDKMVLIDGGQADYREDFKLAISYGFKKFVMVQELLALIPTYSPFVLLDFFGKKDMIDAVKQGFLKRMGKTEEELLNELQFHAIFCFGGSLKVWTLIQVVIDFVSTKDGKIYGPKRLSADEPEFCKYI